MKRAPKTHHCIHIHFRRRLEERYRIHIGVAEWQRLTAEVRQGRYPFLVKESNTRYWYLVKITGQPVYCCYQLNFGLTTVLTAEQFWADYSEARVHTDQNQREIKMLMDDIDSTSYSLHDLDGLKQIAASLGCVSFDELYPGRGSVRKMLNGISGGEVLVQQMPPKRTAELQRLAERLRAVAAQLDEADADAAQWMRANADALDQTARRRSRSGVTEVASSAQHAPPSLEAKSAMRRIS